MSRRIWVFAVPLVALLATFACGEVVVDLFGGQGDAGDVPSEASTDAPPDVVNPIEEDAGGLGDDAACRDKEHVGGSCTRSTDCCSGLCATGATTTTTCRPTPGCIGEGRACDRAGACCSLGCVADDGAYCAGAACAKITEGCARASDCCSNKCSDAGVCASAGAGCRPAGEGCGSDGDCCSKACDVAGRCLLLQGCRVQGETCDVGATCCSGRCTADPSGVLRCDSLAKCTMNDNQDCTRQVGEPCKEPRECCSRQCIGTGDGIKRCAPAGGCRSTCEICETAGQCCSNVCAAGADGVLRCGKAACGAVGEMCEKDGDCCSNGKCAPDAPLGPKRCHASVAPPCHANGDSCRLGSECCSGRCAPNAAGTFTCQATCATLGSPCAARADCCGADVDCMNLGGTQVCAATIR